MDRDNKFQINLKKENSSIINEEINYIGKRSEFNYSKMDLVNQKESEKINNSNRLDLEEIVLTNKNPKEQKDTNSRKKQSNISNEKKAKRSEKEGKDNKSFPSNDNASINSAERREAINNDPILQLFDINLVKYADEIFDMYIENEKKDKIANKKDNKNKEMEEEVIEIPSINLIEVQNLMEVLGIKKNLIEIGCSLKRLKSEKPKAFSQEDKYTKENFIDFVKSFFEFKIEDKILVEVFRKIDTDESGYVVLDDLQIVNEKMGLNFSDEEMTDIIEFFSMEKYLKAKINGENYDCFKSEFDFQKFSKLYYQGN